MQQHPQLMYLSVTIFPARTPAPTGTKRGVYQNLPWGISLLPPALRSNYIITSLSTGPRLFESALPHIYGNTAAGNGVKVPRCLLG